MMELTDSQIAEYHYRSYAAVDGLWFLKVEQAYGFDAALEIDREVWKVLPKIQARKLRALGNLEGGMGPLRSCLAAKLKLDGFQFTAEDRGEEMFRMVISRCPWHDLMVKSGREHLSGRVGEAICRTEYSVWASEFGDHIRFGLPERICDGSRSCILQFSQVKSSLS